MTDLQKLSQAGADTAKLVMKMVATDDTSAIATLCNSLALALVKTADIVGDSVEEAPDHVTSFIRQYQGDLQVAAAAYMEARVVGARLSVVEAQLQEVLHELGLREAVKLH